LQPTSFQPQIVLKSGQGLKASCFCFLNLGSVIATTGCKGKGFLTVHDTLMPPNRPVFHCESTGGKFVSFLPRYHQLLLAGNNGKVAKFDLRRRDVFDVLDTKHEDIFDLKVGPADLSFFTGGADGLVKVWDSSGNHLREVVDICRKGKNKGVSQIECVENCLFASNFDGSVKLLRVIQY
jgi:WD40 repeat protein